MNEGKHDGKVKILMLGESGVGKSSILMRFAKNKFDPDFVTTLGVEYRQKILVLDENRILVQVWDTAGQERFRTITPIYYKSVQGVILVFDITDRDSFDGISYWMDNMGLNTDITKLSIILVGNKCDLENQRKISRKEAETLAANFSVPYYETSAKSSQNINEIYTELSKQIISKDGVILDSKNGEKLENFNKNKNNSSGCCN